MASFLGLRCSAPLLGIDVLQQSAPRLILAVLTPEQRRVAGMSDVASANAVNADGTEHGPTSCRSPLIGRIETMEPVLRMTWSPCERTPDQKRQRFRSKPASASNLNPPQIPAEVSPNVPKWK
jgi:hypothetical protein